MVNIHAQSIRPTTPQWTALSRRSDPTPIIAPVIVCVVLTGMPKAVEISNVEVGWIRHKAIHRF